MKKILLTLSAVAALLIVFAFSSKTENANEITVTVSAKSETTFDMVQNGQLTKGLKTPYQMKVNADEERLLFKSTNITTVLTVEATGGTTKISASWPITVLLIEDGGMTTFGIN